MLEGEYGSAVVVVQEGKVVGIFTERDILYRTAEEGIDSCTPIGELMTRDPATLGPNELLADAIALMVGGGYRHVPLVDGEGRDAGVISSRRVLRFIADHYPEAALNLPPRLHQRLSRPEGA
jgi:CBS domain-containing protein